MVRNLVVWGVFFGCSWTLDAAPATGTSPDSPEAQQVVVLIRQLGNNSYRVREQATKQLIQLGRVAKPALLQGINDPDPEVSDRCRRILPIAREADLKARVDVFLNDKDNKQTHDLPGWSKFQQMIGTDADSRAVYVEMLQANSSLLELVEEEPRTLNEKYNLRLTEMQQALYGPSSGPRPGPRLADINTMLFLGTYIGPATGVNVNLQAQLGNFFYQPVFRNALTSNQGEPVRKLFYAWMEARGDANSIHQGLSVIIQCDLKGALPIAVKVVKNKNTAIHTRAMAMLAMGKLGTKENIPDLEPYLADDGNLGNFQFNNVMGNTQVRDVSLAMSIYLAGQQPKDYGFDMLQAQALNFSYYYNLGFSTDEKRTAAQKKWKDWLAAQPKK